MRVHGLLICVLAMPLVVCADDAELSDKFEITAGTSRTSQSLVHGVLVTYKNDPALNVNYETSQGFASMQNGVGVWLARDALFKAGLSVNYMMGRQEKADPRYAGMGRVAGSAMSYLGQSGSPSKMPSLSMAMLVIHGIARAAHWRNGARRWVSLWSIKSMVLWMCRVIGPISVMCNSITA